MVSFQMIGRIVILCLYIKGPKNMLMNYRPIILLPIFTEIFEKIIFTSMLEYFIENELSPVNQSGFLPGDSSTSQLLV